MDFEDITLYAQYRAGHTGSQASPWRLPPLLAWLPSSPRRLMDDVTLLFAHYTAPPYRSYATPGNNSYALWPPRGPRATTTTTVPVLGPRGFLALRPLLWHRRTVSGALPGLPSHPLTPRRWLLHLDSFTLLGYRTTGLSARRASPWLLSLVLPYSQRWYMDFDSLVLFAYTAAAAVRRVCLSLGHSHLYHLPQRCTSPWTTSRSVATVPPPPYSGRASPWLLSLTTHRTSGCATCLPS